MSFVKFPLEKNETVIIYPDDIIFFSKTRIIIENNVKYVVGEYDGDLELTLYIEPSTYIDLEVAVDKSQYKIGEIITFTGEFSDDSLNIPIVPITILDRNGQHVDNIGVEVKDGLINGAVKFNKPGDYYITNKGINYHKNLLPIELRLKKEVSFRVYR